MNRVIEVGNPGFVARIISVQINYGLGQEEMMKACGRRWNGASLELDILPSFTPAQTGVKQVRLAICQFGHVASLVYVRTCLLPKGIKPAGLWEICALDSHLPEVEHGHVIAPGSSWRANIRKAGLTKRHEPFYPYLERGDATAVTIREESDSGGTRDCFVGVISISP